MRILWFTDYQSPAVRRRLGAPDNPGPQAWVEALAERLAPAPGVELAVATAAERSLPPFEEAGVAYHVLGRRVYASRVSRAAAGWRHRPPAPPLHEALALIRDLSPDLIHVHGTEGAWGLLAPLVAPIPCIISLQGILGAYVKAFFAGRSATEIARLAADREFLVGRGYAHGYLLLRRSARREERIVRAARWFIGRTAWDRAALAQLNPGAVYFHCDEIMRQPFYEAEWERERRDAPSSRLYTTASGLMGKGTECLLRALGILRREGLPTARLRVAGVPPGSGLEDVYRRVAHRSGVADAVEWLGRLAAPRIVDEIRNADVFVYPSRVDNSPNSLVEAMLLGAPIVASRVGGVPSLLKDGEEGLLVPPGDAAALAAAIRRLLDRPELACALGSRARLTARGRNDPVGIVARTLAIYEEVLARNGASPAATRL